MVCMRPVCVVFILFVPGSRPFSLFFNIMMHNSPTYSRKKCCFKPRDAMAALSTLFLHSRSQHELEVSTKQPIFVGSSVSDTIKTCIAMGNERAALRVKSEFKVFK